MSALDRLQKHFEDLDDRVQILQHPQFSRADVLGATGVSSGQLKGMIDREQVRLGDRHNPGTGRRRLYTGEDIIKIQTAVTASEIGFPLRWAYLLADNVANRAINRLIGLADGKDYALATWPQSSGEDWAFAPIYEGQKDDPGVPFAFQVIRVDALIDLIFEKLVALIEDEPLPQTPTFDIQAEPSPYSPENDFFRAWLNDEHGRACYVGLSFEETQELIGLREADHDPLDREARDRFLDLSVKHERARQARLAKEARERIGGEE